LIWYVLKGSLGVIFWFVITHYCSNFHSSHVKYSVVS
jgi:hypothetical protein